MKILSVTITRNRNDAQWTRISNIFKLIENNGLEITLVNYIIKLGRFRKDSEYIQDDNVFIHNPLTLLFIHLIILIKGEYDLVFGNTFAGGFFCILGKLTKKPLILDMHGIAEEYKMYGKSRMLSIVMRLMEKIALLFSDKIICVSHEMISYLRDEKKIPGKKLFYVPNGVDLDFFKQIDNDIINKMKKTYKIEDKLIFGYVGGAHKVQGIEKFILACKEIDNKKFGALIVGYDVSKVTYDNNIIYIPYVEKNEIVNYYSLCDIFVLPRPNNLVTRVAAPTKFVEYLSMGKPILLTGVGDAASLVKKYNNGIVIDNNEIENLKKGINDFLKLGKDKLNQMGLNSRKLAENEFDWNKISDNLMEIIGRL